MATSSGEPTVTWEKEMAETIRANAAARSPEDAAKGPYMVAVAGIPGSGKTTSAGVLRVSRLRF